MKPSYALLEGLCRRLFRPLESLGLHLTPCHYSQPIPDTHTLAEELWKRPSDLFGIHMDEQAMLELLARFRAQFKAEYDAFPLTAGSTACTYYVNNGFFEAVDGEVLYCMVRRFQPRRIVEVGSGFSTRLLARAVLRNRELDPGYACDLVAIDPAPRVEWADGLAGLVRRIPEALQRVPAREVEGLGENDILFIDSSHILKIGSDVQHLFCHVLPRLRRGVLIHFHDVFLPAEYPRHWVMEQHRFWNEQYLLQAVLALSSRFRVVWAGSYMHLKHPERLQAAFGSYDPATRWPGSFWVRKVQ